MSWRPDLTTERRELVARIWSRDPTVWTGKDEARWLGWLDEPFRMREEVESMLDLDGRGRRTAATRSCCSGWAARRSRPRCCGAPSGRSPSTCSTRPIRRRSATSASSSTSSARCSSARRSRARRSRRARTPTTSGGSRRAASNGSRSPIPGSELAALAQRAEVRRRLRGRADDRRPLLGAVAVRARAGRPARRRRRAAPRPRVRDGRCVPPRRRQPRPRARPRARRGLARGPRQGVPAERRTASASGPSS